MIRAEAPREVEVMVMTRTPRPGQVKTRLIPALGAAGAAAVHVALVAETLWRVRRSGLSCVVCLDGDGGGAFARSLARQGVRVQAQPPGDLGARLRHALSGPGRKIAIGTDCPLFSPVWLARAAQDPRPVVVGPAEDGGYWLIAVDAPQDALFVDVPWSTANTLAVTLQRAEAAALPVGRLPTCYDIDTPEDLRRLLADPHCPPGIRAAARPHLR